MKRIFTHLLASFSLLISLLSSQNLMAQTSVVIPGSFQSELGCAGDWDPACDNTRLLQTGAFTWEGSFLIPAGTWYYKVVHDDSWAENYGAGGVPGGADIELTLAVATLMHFTYHSNTHLIDVEPALPPGPFAVTVVGDLQNEIGCAGDWDPNCWASSLVLDGASNTWYGIFNIPPGNWEYKITINNSWAENYGAGGVPGGPNIPLTVSGDRKILFRYNPVTHIVMTNPIDYNVNLAGDFQDEIGCAFDWLPDCFLAGMNFDPSYNLWRKDLY
ncbi:MAG: pullulanase X25 domain-containing protein, partial [Flavisolibacter sp.]